jgi:hypothetical protein
MTGVVLRCPNCGTTRSTPGECEACHEAQVRYYCTNHDPGEWLDEPTCGRCGAKFGDRPPPPRPAPSPSRRSRSPRPPPLRTRDASSGPPPRAERPPAAERPSPWGRRPRSPDGSASGSDRSDPRIIWRRLPDFRRPFPGSRRLPPDLGESPDPRIVVGPSPGGCLRFLLMAVLLFFVGMFFLSFLIGDMAMRVLML